MYFCSASLEICHFKRVFSVVIIELRHDDKVLIADVCLALFG